MKTTRTSPATLNKVIPLVLKLVLVCLCLALIAGCSISAELHGGVGQSGNQAAANMKARKKSGDHSDGTGAGYSQDDNLTSFIKGFKSKRKPSKGVREARTPINDNGDLDSQMAGGNAKIPQEIQQRSARDL